MAAHLHVSVVYASRTTKKQLKGAGIDVNAVNEATYPDVAVGHTSTPGGPAYYLWVRASYAFIASSDGDVRNSFETGIRSVRDVAPTESSYRHHDVLLAFCERHGLQCLKPEWVIIRENR